VTGNLGGPLKPIRPRLYSDVVRRSLFIWLGVWVVAVAGVVLSIILSVREGNGVVVALTLAFTIIAALSASLGSYITWRGNRDAAEQQRQMADDVRRLTELTQGSIEEARAQRPEPSVSFLVNRHRADAATLTRTRVDRTLDVDAIMARERMRALATVPQPPKPKSKTPPAGQLGEAFAGLENLLAIQAAIYEKLGGLGALGMKSGPATAEEKAEFDTRVEKYVTKLRRWLEEYERWHLEVHELVHFQLRFENHGRVPCVGGQYEVHFPDPFEEGPEDDPELADPPARPRFSRPNPFTIPDLTVASLPVADYLRSASIPRVASNVSRPRFRKGSVIVDIEVKKLLHGVYEDSDPITLRCPTDGVYTVPWQIHAENLSEPATGELKFELITRVETGTPITDIDELLALVWPGSGDDVDDDK